MYCTAFRPLKKLKESVPLSPRYLMLSQDMIQYRTNNSYVRLPGKSEDHYSA